MTPANPDYERDVRASFARQQVMSLIGARIARVAPGLVEIELPFRDDLTQQHGFFHGGMVATIGDSAAGYAAFTLFPPGSAVLSVEFKLNFVTPAAGTMLHATGRVKKAGRTLTVCEFEVDVAQAGGRKACAHGLATMMCLAETRGLAG